MFNENWMTEMNECLKWKLRWKPKVRMSHNGCDGQLDRIVVVVTQVPLSHPHCELAWQEAGEEETWQWEISFSWKCLTSSCSCPLCSELLLWRACDKDRKWPSLIFESKVKILSDESSAQYHKTPFSDESTTTPELPSSPTMEINGRHPRNLRCESLS